MAKNRARDDRRSVGSHEKMMGALGRATGTVKAGPAIVANSKNTKGAFISPVEAPGRGHVSVGRSHPDYGFRHKDEGWAGTAGISGEHKGRRGAPSNLFHGED